MNPIVFALRHPIAIMVMMAGIVAGSGLALFGQRAMKIDIFPQLNLPVVYVCQPYGGMDPAQMEGLLTYYYEYHFLYVSGIHHVESKNIQGVAMMKLYFHPGTDMAQAMAETIQYVNRSRAFMPPGTVPPFVMRFDTGSVPVGYLVLSSETKTITEIQDQALNRVRPMFAKLPGVSAPPPFGGSARSIVVRADPDRLRAYSASPDDVVAALMAGNVVSPSGAYRDKDRMPLVVSNAMVKDPRDIGKIAIRPGSSVYLRDLAVITDSQDITTGYAVVNGRRAVYILVTKRSDASTLSVVNAVRENLEKMRNALPKDIRDDIQVSFEFDQSPHVTGSMRNVVIEGLLGALLTGLMVFLFLRDWRSVIVVVLNIPLSLLGSIFALWLCGQSINLMTLGGLALSVGILVDEATVEVENIHTQMSLTDNIARAVRLGNAETAVPRLLAMLCILAVFVPAFFMQGSAQALFVPMSLAVGFSMITSYLLSSSFVPVMSVWLLQHYTHADAEAPGFFARLQTNYADLVTRLLAVRTLLLSGYAVVAAVVLGALVMYALAFTGHIGLANAPVGTEIFPTVDAGQFQLRLRAPTGTRIERTEQIAVKTLEFIADKVGADNVSITVGYVGTIPSSFPINAVYQWMSGPEEAILKVALRPGSDYSVERLKEELRDELPEKIEGWLRPILKADKFTDEQIDERMRNLKLSFEPADIVNQVMSFGAATPVEVVVSSPSYDDNLAFADRIKTELEKIPALRDLQYAQPINYPTIEVSIDREMAGRGGATAEDVARAVVAATSSSRFVVPNYWRDPKSGIGYQVQVELPIERINSPRQIGLIPIRSTEGKLLLQNIAEIRESQMPGQIDRYNMRRLITIMANVEGEDLGRVSARVKQAIADAGEKPNADMDVDVRGQIEPMNEMFTGLAIGLALAVLAIFLLLTAYFQSVRLALTVMATAPAVVAGVALMLMATGTTLNIQSFMGAIMAVGVATANAILLVTFAEKARKRGDDPLRAALDGAKHRLRPILMTSFAMIAGMMPMALAFGDGGQQVAPLGRAVIGGLIAATAATLLVLPALFAVVQANASRASVSLDPDDPESKHYDGAKV
jgi:multidrug efflux pump subunit AcrB